MKVLELLMNCDLDMVARQYSRRRDYDGEPALPETDIIREGMEKFISDLAQRDVRESDEYIIVPVRYIQDGESELFGDLVKKADIIAFESEFNMSEMDSRIEKARCCPIDDLSPLIPAKTIESYGYSFTPWEEVLGYDVFLPNNESEFAAEFAEDILWEMTFNGMTDEEQKERRAELDEMIEHSKQSLNENNYKSWDEFKEEMAEKYGIIDTRTPQEREEAKRRLYIEMLQNDVARNCVILACKAWLFGIGQCPESA